MINITEKKLNAILFLMGQRAVEEGKVEEFIQYCNNLTGGKNESIYKKSGKTSTQKESASVGM